MKYGIPSEPEVFLNRAIEAGHPRDLIGHVGKLIHGVIVENFHGDPFKLAKRRTDFLKKYSDSAVTLRSKELKLRAKKPRHVRDVLKNKRLALIAKMLTDLGFPDTEWSLIFAKVSTSAAGNGSPRFFLLALRAPLLRWMTCSLLHRA